MASEYALYTVANLESLLGGIDLETADSRLTDDTVEKSIITPAERQLCGITGTTYTSSTLTIPSKAVLESWLIYYAETTLIRLGRLEPERATHKGLLKLTEITKDLLEPARDLTKAERGIFIKKYTG